jgi:hypothetical protein
MCIKKIKVMICPLCRENINQDLIPLTKKQQEDKGI